jgi:type II secretion system protein H
MYQYGQKKSTQGFTLMELMIVMAIIGIASAVIIPRIGHNEGKIYRVQLRTLTAAMNYNRRSAIIMNRPFELKLFPRVNDEELISNKSKKSLKKGDWISQGADISWKSGTKTMHNKLISIKYFPQGGATGGTISLQQGRYRAELTIDGITGKFVLEESSRDGND